MPNRQIWGVTIIGVLALTEALCHPGLLSAQDRTAPRECRREGRRSLSGRVIVMNTERRSVLFLQQGEVELSTDDRDVLRVSPGSRLVIAEQVVGSEDRCAAFRAGQGGSVQRDFWVDGRPRAWDGEARAWTGRMLEEAARESGFGAEDRIARAYGRGGLSAAFNEVARVRSDGVKRVYFTVLLAQRGLPAADAARAIRRAGDEIESPGDLRVVLTHAIERGPVQDAAVAGAVLATAARIRSDGDKLVVLTRYAERASLAAAPVRDAFFVAARSIGSDGDLRVVLDRTLRMHASDRAVALGALGAVRGIRSDGDKAVVLLATSPAHLRDERFEAAFVEAMRTIGSDGDYRRVASWLLRNRP